MREMARVVDKTVEKHPESVEYLICIRAKEDSGMQDEWDIIKGRSEAYEYIKNRIEYIDFESSFILAESKKLSEKRSIYLFVKFAADYFGDNFDISDYIRGDWDEEWFKRSNSLDPQFNDGTLRTVSMSDMLNGEYKYIDK